MIIKPVTRSHQQIKRDGFCFNYGYPQKRGGKMQRLAIFALSYGGSYKTASYISGLGLRRVKVIAKQLRGS